MDQLETQPADTRIHIDDPFAVAKFAQSVHRRLRQLNANAKSSIVLLCIGTDRSTGDCLGPLVGSQMEECGQDLFTVYGTLNDPVHATNLEKKLDEIYRNHPDSIIIALDASLGYTENVGSITIGEGALKPGAGVRKKLPAVGDMHITGIVNIGGFMEHLVLQNTRLNVVMRLAKVISEGLQHIAAEYRKLQVAEENYHSLHYQSPNTESIRK
ncbi:MAG: spore protease YyaC [Peptococcaceae bacterium]|nr:spore protease YyaC [Peptococcaceae bacterium]